MTPRRANTRNANARNANAAPPVLDQIVSTAEFSFSIQMLAQSMTNQNNRLRAHVKEIGGLVSTRVREFVSINPSEFLGSSEFLG